MIRLFREKRIGDAFNIVRENILNRVSRLSEYEIMNSEIENLANGISESLSIKPIGVDFDNRNATVDMVEIPWNRFPRQYDVRPGKSYSCARITYTFPITKGDKELLSVLPQGSYFDKDIRASIDNDNLAIEYQTLYGNIQLSEQIKKEVKGFISETVALMKTVIPTIEKEVNEFNETISSTASDLIQQRKDMIQATKDQNDELNDF